jgi:hypothetical protein
VKSSLRLRNIVVLLMALTLFDLAYSHENQVPAKAKPAPSSDETKRALKVYQINEAYKKSVKPIFQRSCFDCHSQLTRYPWYYKIPGANGLIDSDTAEAKKHIDLTSDFPFQGHGSPEEDLLAIRKTVKESTMPPLRYWILHPGARLNETEQKTILQWVEESFGELSK